MSASGVAPKQPPSILLDSMHLQHGLSPGVEKVIGNKPDAVHRPALRFGATEVQVSGPVLQPMAERTET